MPDNRPLTPQEVARLVRAALATGQSAWTAVVTGPPTTALLGRRVVFIEGVRRGTLGDGALDTACSEAFSQSLAEDPAPSPGRAPLVTAQGEVVEVYLEVHAPTPLMVIVGAGHIAQPLSTLGRLLGMKVEVLDDRSEFATAERFPSADAVRVIDFRNPFADTTLAPSSHVVLVTRGHQFDYECLVHLLGMEAPPRYIGMIGSRRRVRATHEQLQQDGFTPEQMKRVRAPVGLDLGGQTPAEIAVSVAAEIVMLQAGGSGGPLTDRERVVERFFENNDANVEGT